MKNWIIAALIAFPLIALILYLILREDKEETKAKDQSEVKSLPPVVIAEIPTPPIVRPTLGSPTIGGNTNLPPSYIYDPLDFQKFGGLQVKLLAEKVLRNEETVSDIMSANNIGDGMFDGLQEADTIEAFILEQLNGTDANDVPLMPEWIEDDFVRKLKALKNSPDIKTERNRSKEKAENAIAKLCDFTSIVGYRLCPIRLPSNDLFNHWIRSGNVYGECKGWKKKREACNTDHWVKFQLDMQRLADNLLDRNEIFADALLDYCVNILRGKGYAFVGYDPMEGKVLAA